MLNLSTIKSLKESVSTLIPNIDSIENYLADSSKGFKIYGSSSNDQLGNAVSPAGDINGDGLADVIIGAGAVIFNSGWNTKGAAYVIYGNEDGIPNIGAVDSAGSVEEYIAVASKGFRIFDSKTVSDPNTYYSHYGSYYSSASAGDINGDGLADIIIGAGGASPNGLNNAGAAYIIYGKKGGLPDLGQFLQYEIEGSQGYLTDSSKGFKIYGSNSGDSLGNTVSSPGDINGDGVTDIIVGASGASPNGLSSAGAAYVIYGGEELPNINSIENYLTDSSKGFKIYGSNSGDSLGNSVSSAGDVNGDGIDDIIIGTTGAAYIIYGKKGGLSNINSIKNYLNDPYNGFSIYGLASDCFGHQVSSAGDINGDGIGDIIIGASCANPNGLSRAGAAYVVYGVSSTSTKNTNDYNTGTTLSSETKVAVLTVGVLLGVAISGWLLWKYCYQGKFCPVNHITAAATVPSAPPEEYS